jgi:acid phosphatase
VITDVDETVLDNTPFQAKLVLKNAAFDAGKWTAWVREYRAEAIPGAKEFIAFLKSKNIRVFYVTNRTQKEPTLLNLQRVIDPEVTAEQVLCKNEQPGWGSDKTSRRAFLAQRYRILLLLGDDYNDFFFLGNVSPEERTTRAESQTAFWGQKWFLISNPLYGSWERALYGFDYRLSADQQRNKKIRHLKASY